MLQGAAKTKKKKERKRKQVTYIASFILLPDSTVIEALQQMCPFRKDEAKRLGGGPTIFRR